MAPQDFHWTVDMLTALCLLVTETDLTIRTNARNTEMGYEDAALIFNAIFARPAVGQVQAIGPFTGTNLQNKFGGRWGDTKPALWRTHVLRRSGYFTVAEMQHRASLRQHLLAVAAALNIPLGPQPSSTAGAPLSGDDRQGGNISVPFLKGQNTAPNSVAQQWNGGAGYLGAGVAPIPAPAAPVTPLAPVVAQGMPAGQQAQPPLPGPQAAMAPGGAPAQPPPQASVQPQPQPAAQGDGEDDAEGSDDDEDVSSSSEGEDNAAPVVVQQPVQVPDQAQQEERYRGELIEGENVYSPRRMYDTWKESGLGKEFEPS